MIEDMIDVELYLERTESGAFECIYENGEWTKKVSQAIYGSIVTERWSEYGRIYWEYFARSYEEIEYSDEEKGYVCRFLSGDGITNQKCTYKLKDKKIVSISAEGITDAEKFNRRETIEFMFTYGKQKLTVPESAN